MEHLADVMIRPRLEQYSGVHFRAIPEMMQEGYDAGLLAAQEIRAVAMTQAATRATTMPEAPARPTTPPFDRLRAFGPAPHVVPPGGA